MQTNATQHGRLSVGTQERLGAVIVLALLGMFIVWGVGFAQSSTLHNAAHDSRHSMAFPCH
ncbi:MAG: CbtB-domain containing protein [Alphaproteobacteria bacterium]|nr:CbtB-domain containing protein [Alphaproteobacteria bacterium]